MFLCLGIYLAIRYQDFWQLPLATGGCLVFPALLYKFFSADIQLYIPAGKAAVSMSFGGYFKHTLIDKNEVQIVQNTLNGKPYMAIASKNNPYGRSYQISPFLTSAHKDKLYNENILPVIKQQLLS
ncbi:MAG: hypothetical protein JO154_06600 [Chitinophaga sp.]|uniref:hypothetical protein n=1 Tax=Chitinophaga sp. TaxID=1869181 RepID=UPI0025BAEC6B|nr:hypothetical protein [Chitinophaga sp.]MBV8252262.1 hypothetical protein [Chitinophaga sp.]